METANAPGSGGSSIRMRTGRGFIGARRACQGMAVKSPQKEWSALNAEYNHCCLCCGKRTALTADHVEPVESGGESYIENIQPLCGPCNSANGTKHTDYRIKTHPNCLR